MYIDTHTYIYTYRYIYISSKRNTNIYQSTWKMKWHWCSLYPRTYETSARCPCSCRSRSLQGVGVLVLTTGGSGIGVNQWMRALVLISG